MNTSNDSCCDQAGDQAISENLNNHDGAAAKPINSSQGCCGSKPNGQGEVSGEILLPTTSCCGGATEARSTTELATRSSGDRSETNKELPVVVIGGGPVGLAAAANLVERKQDFIVLEAGGRIAASMWKWRHVRLFTPWSFLIDPAGRRLLEADGNWKEPDVDRVPYASELVESFLDPLAKHDDIAPHIKLKHKVISVSREGHDRIKDGRRNEAPFLIVVETPEGPQRLRARAVIDASGTWTTPNPLGAGGVFADGERQSLEHIQYGMPDVLGLDRERYAGKKVLVVGSGHSATGNVLSLGELAKAAPGTSIAWGIRRVSPTKLWGAETPMRLPNADF
ncbi:NAD(P)-binding domain-containing protein [Bremerella alba]|uniref:Uncharacterized protein n=1 Tax=Bremerella alba TaxID=980252 RepID=A0A7V8V8S0_9BACT|nr:NAD(P)-binding domain-containing protein [Bremerella alba]MBA2117055.1 hypothetical protein [Bremerella alba]